ncbi:MAG: FapA family protein [Spirochaetia bacterium]|nr:FapA family protein [Spirochaetia bacterium]
MVNNGAIISQNNEARYALISEGSSFYTIGKHQLINKLEKIYKLLIEIENDNNRESRDYPLEPGIFLTNKETFITITNASLSNITLQTDQTILTRTKGSRTELIAQTEGYLIAKNRVFSIYDPYKLSKDKIHLYYIFCPVNYGQKSLNENFFKKASLPSRESAIHIFSNEGISKTINSKTIDVVTLSMGVTPVYGEDDTLTIKKYPDSKPHINDDGSIDHHTYSAFLEVKEGTVLAEKTEGELGIQGIDAFGNNIPVPAVKKIAFKAGNNVHENKTETNLIIYTAGVTGILELTDHSVSVTEELHIRGNICADTGNISYSKSVTIDGDVEYPYKIECGDSLTIKGCIENGAIIHCKGNLIVEKGIIGEKTSLLAKGDVETAFIQDAKIRVLGNLTVNSYIYNSHVFCGSELNVIGDKVKSTRKGVILGSTITSMKKMVIHSAGSNFSKTVLSCGLDLELEEQLNEVKKAVPQINTKILRLQNRIGLDLTQKDIGKKLQALPQRQKNKIKGLLEEIKYSATQKETVEKMIEELKDKTSNPNIEELYIEVSSHIIPDTTIIMGGLEKKIEDPEKSICIIIEHNKIAVKPL